MQSKINKPEASPYLERQRVFAEIIDHTLNKKLTGIVPIGAITGSGKTFSIGKQVGEIVAAGYNEEEQCYNKAPSRKYIVVAIPERANRDDFCRDLLDGIESRRDLSIAEKEDLKDSILRLDGAIDNINAIVQRHPAFCPLLEHDAFKKDEATKKQMEDLWRKLVGWVSIRDGAQDTVLQAPVSKKGLEVIDAEIRECDKSLRNLVEDVLHRRLVSHGKATKDAGLMRVIEQIWSAAKLARLSHAVIILTPQKLLYPVDTLVGVPGFGRRVNLTSKEFAKRTVYMLDEFDKQYQDWLSTYIGGSLRVDEIQLAKDIRDRLVDETSKVTPLFMGNLEAWKNEEEASDERGFKSRIQEGQIEGIARSYENFRVALEAVYQDLNLAYMFKTCSDLDSTETRGIRNLFNYESPQFKPSGVKKPTLIAVKLDLARAVNRVGFKKGDSDNNLQYVLSRVHGIIAKQACFHLIRVANAYRGLYPHCDMNDALFNAAHMTALPQETCRILVQYAENQLYKLGSRKQGDMKNAGGRRIQEPLTVATEDQSLYHMGCKYLELEDARTHRAVTYFFSNGLDGLPEARLALIASEAPVFAISATYNAPTVNNWDLRYLDRVAQVCSHDNHLIDFGEEIKTLTEQDNEICKQSYTLNIHAASKGNGLADSLSEDDVVQAFQGLGLSPKTTQDIARIVCEKIPVPAGDDAYLLERLYKLLQAGTDFIKAAKDGKHHAMVCLSSKYLGDESAEAVTARDALGRIGRDLLGDCVSRLVYTAKAANWEQETNQFHEQLKEGKPAILLASYPSGGFSKNLQYRCPEELLSQTVVIDRGLPEVSHKVDIDYLYLADPTNKLISKIQNEEEGWNEAAIKTLVQFKKLAEFGELSPAAAWDRTEACLSRSRPGLMRDLPSAAVEGARIISQGIGRVCRTSRKFKRVTIAYDEKIAANCDFAFLDNLPVGYELRNFIEHVAAQEKAMPVSRLESNITRCNNLAILANARSKAIHRSLLQKLMNDAPTQEDLDAFDAERQAAIVRGVSVSEEVVEREPLIVQSYVELPCEGMGYAFRQKDDYADVDIAIPLPGETLEEALRTLQLKKKEGSSGVVSADKAQEQLNQLIACPVVREHFEAKGFATHFGPSKYFPTPYVYNSVIRGAWGEEAGCAILKQALGRMYGFTRGSANQAERAGDYLVLRSDGQATGVWIDFKNYEFAADVDCCFDDAKDRFVEKAAKVGAKGIVVVNLVDSLNNKAATAVISPGNNGEARVVSLSRLLDGAEIDLKAIGILSQEIERMSCCG